MTHLAYAYEKLSMKKALRIFCYQAENNFVPNCYVHLKMKHYQLLVFIFYFVLILIYFWVIKSNLVQFGAIWSNFVKPSQYNLDFWSNLIPQMILFGSNQSSLFPLGLVLSWSKMHFTLVVYCEIKQKEGKSRSFRSRLLLSWGATLYSI